MRKLKVTYVCGEDITPSIVNESFSDINELDDRATKNETNIGILDKSLEETENDLYKLSKNVSENYLSVQEFNTVLSECADIYFPN